MVGRTVIAPHGIWKGVHVVCWPVLADRRQARHAVLAGVPTGPGGEGLEVAVPLLGCRGQVSGADVQEDEVGVVVGPVVVLVPGRHALVREVHAYAGPLRTERGDAQGEVRLGEAEQVPSGAGR